jgi:hypothetical protein
MAGVRRQDAGLYICSAEGDIVNKQKIINIYFNLINFFFVIL